MARSKDCRGAGATLVDRSGRLLLLGNKLFICCWRLGVLLLVRRHSIRISVWEFGRGCINRMLEIAMKLLINLEKIINIQTAV
jgi:hypothetical protein